MSHVIALANRSSHEFNSGDIEALTMIEKQLFMDILECKAQYTSRKISEDDHKNQQEEFFLRSQRIDLGGIFRETADEMKDYNIAFKSCTTTKNTYWNRPEYDDTAAAHICVKDMKDLAPTVLSKLDNNIINYSKILWVEVREPCFKREAITALVWDDDNVMITLYLCNFVSLDATLHDVQYKFPVGCRLGIKEPYLKCMSSGFFGLRVDNPLNVIHENLRLKTMNTIELKEEGNILYRSMKYLDAVEAYSVGLSQCLDKRNTHTCSDELLVTLHSNRALCYLRLHEWKLAVEDAEAILVVDPYHMKATFRIVQAYIGLHEFALALRFLHNHHTQSEEILQSIKKTQMMQLQSEQGIYDMMTISFDPLHQDDVTDYYGPLDIKSAGCKGRGLFLIRDVQEGELLLAEKAFAFIYQHPNQKIPHSEFAEYSHVRLITDIVLAASTSEMSNSILQCLSTNKISFSFIPSLQNIKYKRLHPTALMSAADAKGIIDINAFECTYCVQPTEAMRRILSTTSSSNKPPHFSGNTASNASTTLELSSPIPQNEIMAIAMHPQSARELVDAIKNHPIGAINAMDPSGFTALHCAVMRKELLTCKLLLRYGADPNAANAIGFTSLHFSVGEFYHHEITCALLESRASVNAVSVRRLTPLHAATKFLHVDCISLLLQHGADPHIEELTHRQSALDWAARSSSPEVKAAFTTANLQQVDRRHGAGLWVVTSFFNHANMPNTNMQFIGKMMFIRALRDMKAGQEVTICYNDDGSVVHKKWGIGHEVD
jgi:ankyrin repeat protein